MRIRITASILLLALSLPTGSALAQSAGALPEWERLTPQQRETLTAIVRDRWNDEPEKRDRMLRHAERWQQMTPEQRRHAHHGMRRWKQMSPEGREGARVLYQRMRELPKSEREALRERWKAMTPEQRHEWLERHQPEE
ncbi:DUF3106 domain-containing protein [Luteimonas salinilitoris]|uniref:DUF3106 domain-containing protein n=1 Tax=Luteimonas salinilitoris TaxID=3237697 RepID=A0ABV4HKV9_9GAMM